MSQENKVSPVSASSKSPFSLSRQGTLRSSSHSRKNSTGNTLNTGRRSPQQLISPSGKTKYPLLIQKDTTSFLIGFHSQCVLTNGLISSSIFPKKKKDPLFKKPPLTAIINYYHFYIIIVVVDVHVICCCIFRMIRSLNLNGI